MQLLMLDTIFNTKYYDYSLLNSLWLYQAEGGLWYGPYLLA